MFFEQYFCPYSAPFPPTPHRTAPTLHPAMANCNIKPVGVTGCQGLQAGVNINPNPELPATDCGDQGQSITGGGRSTEAARQRGNKDDQPVSHPVCQQNICGPKKGWVLQAGYQSETTEPVHSSCALQNRRPSHAERSTETGGLDGLHRPKGRLPVRRNLGRAPEVSAVCLEQPTIRILVSPIRSMQCAKGLHQTAEACISKTPPPRDPADHVFGRYVGDGPVEGGVGGTPPTNYITYRVPGILSQPGEVPADLIPGNTILGFF